MILVRLQGIRQLFKLSLVAFAISTNFYVLAFMFSVLKSYMSCLCDKYQTFRLAYGMSTNFLCVGIYFYLYSKPTCLAYAIGSTLLLLAYVFLYSNPPCLAALKCRQHCYHRRISYFLFSYIIQNICSSGPTSIIIFDFFNNDCDIFTIASVNVKIGRVQLTHLS